MGAKRQLKARLVSLERRDLLRRLEVEQTDAALVDADERLRRQREESRLFVLALCERIFAAHSILANRAEKPAVRPWWEQDCDGGCPL